jgi:hypothetical protein
LTINIINSIKMSSHADSPTNISDDPLTSYEPLPAPTTSTLPNAFGRMMGESSATINYLLDKQPAMTYNHNYNPHQAPEEGHDPAYSPYVYGERLYDDRPIIMTRIPIKHVLTGASKRGRTSIPKHQHLPQSDRFGHPYAKTSLLYIFKRILVIC